MRPVPHTRSKESCRNGLFTPIRRKEDMFDYACAMQQFTIDAVFSQGGSGEDHRGEAIKASSTRSLMLKSLTTPVCDSVITVLICDRVIMRQCDYSVNMRQCELVTETSKLRREVPQRQRPGQSESSCGVTRTFLQELPEEKQTELKKCAKEFTKMCEKNADFLKMTPIERTKVHGTWENEGSRKRQLERDS